jgi:hypothetical protein
MFENRNLRTVIYILIGLIVVGSVGYSFLLDVNLLDGLSPYNGVKRNFK